LIPCLIAASVATVPAKRLRLLERYGRVHAGNGQARSAQSTAVGSSPFGLRQNWSNEALSPEISRFRPFVQVA
jgi:hypothetical protein